MDNPNSTAIFGWKQYGLNVKCLFSKLFQFIPNDVECWKSHFVTHSFFECFLHSIWVIVSISYKCFKMSNILGHVYKIYIFFIDKIELIVKRLIIAFIFFSNLFFRNKSYSIEKKMWFSVYECQKYFFENQKFQMKNLIPPYLKNFVQPLG